MKLHPDEAVLHDVFIAAYAAYHGYPVLKTSDRNGGEWTFLIPSCDLEILQSEFDHPETSLYVKEFVSSVKRVQNAMLLAKQNCGEYITAEWKAATRR
jgi:hypothetical protein